MSEVFGFSVKNSLLRGTASLLLPTFDQPRNLIVRPSDKGATDLQTILGVCIGLVLLAVAGYLGYIGKQNPQKFRKYIPISIDSAITISQKTTDFLQLSPCGNAGCSSD